MSKTNITKHPDFAHIGSAVLSLYDEMNDLLVVTGKADDLVLRKAVTLEALTEIVNGVAVESKAQPVSEAYTLTGRLVETLDPNTQYLMLKNCGTPAKTGTCGIGTEKEKVQMFAGRQIKLKRESGFYGAGALPAPQAVSAGKFGTGGGISTGTYTFTVTAVYDGTEGAYKDSNSLAVTLGECIALTIVPPGAGASPTPNFFRVYVAKSPQTRQEAKLILETNTTNVFFSTWTLGTTYPGDQDSSFTVTDETGEITYDAGVDYSIDESCAMFCLEEGGAIADGQWVIVQYTYYTNPYVEMTIGPSGRLPKYVHPVILSFHDDDREPPVGRGVEIHLWKVVADSGWDWELSRMDFGGGFNFEWKVLLSEQHLNHGYIWTFHRQFSGFGLIDFANLTKWSNAPTCEVPGS